MSADPEVLMEVDDNSVLILILSVHTAGNSCVSGHFRNNATARIIPWHNYLHSLNRHPWVKFIKLFLELYFA